MELIRIQNPSHPWFHETWQIYEASFPLAERRPLAEHIRALENETFHYNLLAENGELIGLLSWWDWTAADGTPYRFGEHFAVAPTLRGGGYGSQALEFLKGDESHIVLLEIDPPTDDISRRREQFYQRNGLVTNPSYDHVHPSFRPTTAPHRLLIMSYPRPLTPDEFHTFQRFNNEVVLSYTER